jgi:hypothetical protein
VNFSRILSFGALVIALAITLPLKLTVVPQRLSDNFEQAIAALLTSKGFEIKIGSRFGLFVINAVQNNCRLEIREVFAQGYNVDAIEADVPKDAQFVFEYGGKLWKTLPTLRATISGLWSRLKWQLGVNSLWSPVISIAAVGPCAIETLPWDEVASIRAK